jgi:hypothetical protein
VYAGTENGMWISFDGGRKWNDFRNAIPAVSVHDIRFQPQWDDLLIATHGRALYIMDDMRMIQDLPSAIASGYAFTGPRTSYEYNTHSDDEGIYTDYSGANPPTGAMMFFYQKAAPKTAPKIEILDAAGHVIRTVSGTHKVIGKEEPVISNKVGINRFVWDFAIDGPVKWLGAAKESYQGPSHGPTAPPGKYAARMTLGGRTYTRPFIVKADPQTVLTQAQFNESFDFSKVWTARFSVVDTMLNGLDAVRKQLQSVKSPSLTSQARTAEAARMRVFNELTANYQNDEDSIQRPGALREDIQGLGFQSGSIISPPLVEFAKRIEANYRKAVSDYNAYVESVRPLIATIHEKAPEQVRP